MTEERIKRRFDIPAPFLNEKQKRLYAGCEAAAYGSGGVDRGFALLGMSADTVSRGMKEVRNPETVESDRTRQHGGG